MFGNALFVSFSHPHAAPALRSLLELVGRDDGRVRAMAVIEPTPKLQRLLTPHDITEHVEEALRHTVTNDLREVVAKAVGHRGPAGSVADRQVDVEGDVEIEVATGHVVAEVLRRIVDRDHDLLALTGHPDDPFARAVIKRLQRKSPCPVWAIRPSRARKRRILAAVDTDADHHGLDHRILTAARWLARPGDELHVVTAWELLGESTLRSSPFIGTGEHTVDELRAGCEVDHRHALEQLVADARFDAVDDVDVCLHVRNGAAAEVIVDVIEHHRINQLVLGTIGRTGIPGFVIGNTAERLLGEIECSELVVKPPGFTSAFVS
jgi:nucleotide-binding universal stress UspA family protein